MDDNTEDLVEASRERKLTEKGLMYSMNLYRNQRTRLIKSLTILSGELERLISQPGDVDLVRPVYSKWIGIYEELLETHDKYQAIFTDLNDKQVDNASFQDKNRVFLSTNQSAKDWFILNKAKTISPQHIVQDDQRSHRSGSVRSHRSSGARSHRSARSSNASHISKAKLMEEQRKVELLARAEALSEKKQLEEAKLKLKIQEEELEIKTELKVSDAKSKVIEELEKSMRDDDLLEFKLNRHENLTEVSYNQKPRQSEATRMKTYVQEETSRLNPQASEWIPSKSTPRVKNYDLVNRNTPVVPSESISIVRELNKPQIDIQKFDGNPMLFNGFKRQFQARIESNTASYDERLTYLLQFTLGEPHRIVKGFSHLDAETGYTASMNELQDRYGEPDVIANSFVRKALDWPVVKQDNPKALDDFSIFLTECLYAVQNVDEVRVLEYSDNMKTLVRKLPFNLQDKWRNIVYETKSQRRTLLFSQLVDFVKREAKKANDPIYGKDVMRTPSSVKKLQESKSSSYGNRKTLATSVESNSQNDRNDSTDSKPNAFSKPCVYCGNSSHSLKMCDKITSKSLKDRYDFLKSKGFCFGCLKYGHQKVVCSQKATCSVCKKGHPSILHVDSRKQKVNETCNDNSVRDVTSSATSTGAGDVVQQALPILPVRIKCAKSDKFVETYAFLDCGSTATFCSETIMRELNVEGKKTKLGLLTMTQTETDVKDCYVVSGLEISDLNGNNVISLPTIFSQEKLPVTSSDIVSVSDISNWPHLRDIPLQRISNDHVGLLIGVNVPRAMEPWSVVPCANGGPFAVETVLGWVINGPLNVSRDENTSCNFVRANRISASVVSENRIDVSLEDQIRNQFDFDFCERTIDDVNSPSVEDRKFLDNVSRSITLENGHYIIDLPFKSNENAMPNNRKQAEQRLMLLAKRFEKDKHFQDEYVTFMKKVLGEGYASEVSSEDLLKDDGHVWYLPHHGVYHPRKNKIRVVFDCAARFQGTSLNERLLQGPNLTNSLVGTLIRFRQDDIAIMGDIDSMFHQVRVPTEDGNYLRFLWWKDGHTNSKPIEYQMNVHLFGATSSPSCVNYALRQTAEEGRGHFNDKVIDTVLRNFYVDDCLKSVETVDGAITLVQDLQALLRRGGFRIAKWISSSRDVMRSIPISDRAKEVKDIDLDQEILPIDRALGVQWCVETDTFQFKISLQDKPKTRRGILSMVSSVYDPLGFLAPLTLRPKIILQELCKLRLAWDDPVPDVLLQNWEIWYNDLSRLSSFSVPRCFKPPDFGNVLSAHLHHFADASESGYGVLSYLRLENVDHEIHCSFVMGKARVTPLKQVTIPRLELTAATVAVRTNKMIISELEIPIDHSYFWTDSMSVLRYINNTTARFQTFVANRLSVIHEGSNVSDWRYINTKMNPADISSRGASANDLLEKHWIDAPAFLNRHPGEWPSLPTEDLGNIDTEDREIKRAKVATVVLRLNNTNIDIMLKLFEHYSSWYKLKRAVAWIIKVKEQLLKRVRKLQTRADHRIRHKLTLKDLEESENTIISIVQQEAFRKEIGALKSGNPKIHKDSRIRTLDPFLDGNLLRVGGRLHSSSLPENSKHPVILPKNNHVSNLILHHFHILLKHSGRNHMLSALRQRYWIISAPSAIRKIISKCVNCRRVSAKVGEQKMAELPEDRVLPDDPPFTRVGVDYFGPFEVKQRRSRVKRHGVIFTCLASRAVHLEIASSLDTDSYINVLRRFVSRRGQVSLIRSDNGTNFIGAEREMKQAIDEWNLHQIESSMLQNSVEWKFNPPSGSHFGGIWERLIRSIRRVISSVIKEQVLDDDGLHTLMCEVEAILNSRPITMNSDNPNDLEALTPNHLLLMKCKPVLPPGLFSTTDNYCRRRWRQIQYMSNLFWSRWLCEYLPILQERQKWNNVKRNLHVGDVVLVVDSNSPRNSWPMGLVHALIPDRNGLVRQVKVKIGSTILTRPIDKLCTILELD